MTTSELARKINSLPHGARVDLAVKLECDPSKISKAIRGFIRDKSFLGRLENAVDAMIDSTTAVQQE